MASINEVYGKNYQQETKESKLHYSAKIIATNIANLSLSHRYDSDPLWDGHSMKPEAVKIIIEQVRRINEFFYVTHIDKTGKFLNVCPYLLNGPVEYFYVVDKKRNRVYLIYVTPYNMEPF